MATPSPKSEQVEQDLQEIFGFDRRVFIKMDVCVPRPQGCGGPAKEFTNTRAQEEYTISGLCQKCQNKIERFFSDE